MCVTAMCCVETGIVFSCTTNFRTDDLQMKKSESDTNVNVE